MPIYIALGANLSSVNAKGEAVTPAMTFKAAKTALEQLGVNIVQMSALWQSPAWPKGSNQPDYINACACVETKLSPIETLKALHEVEAQFGRERLVKNAARPLDLDLLDYEGRIVDVPNITIPHPRMLDRGFVLFPLEQLAPDWRDPKEKRAIQDWIARLPLDDVEPIKKL